MTDEQKLSEQICLASTDLMKTVQAEIDKHYGGKGAEFKEWTKDQLEGHLFQMCMFHMQLTVKLAHLQADVGNLTDIVRNLGRKA